MVGQKMKERHEIENNDGTRGLSHHRQSRRWSNVMWCASTALTPAKENPHTKDPNLHFNFVWNNGRHPCRQLLSGTDHSPRWCTGNHQRPTPQPQPPVGHTTCTEGGHRSALLLLLPFYYQPSWYTNTSVVFFWGTPQHQKITSFWAVSSSFRLCTTVAVRAPVWRFILFFFFPFSTIFYLLAR